VDQNLHDLIHSLHEADKWLEKVKSLVDKMIADEERREREDRFP
jgi:hypothetical protein